MDEKSLCSWKLCFLQYYQCRLFPPPHSTGAGDAHKRHQEYNLHITVSKLHISCSENHDWTLLLVFYCFSKSSFQPSPISLLMVILFRSVLLSMLLNYKKKLCWCLIDWQLSIPNVNGHACSYPLPPLWQWGLNLDLNGIEGVVIHFSVPKTIVSTLLLVNIFTGRHSFMGARRAHKRLFLVAICSSDSCGLLTRIRSLYLLHA